jgi:hypothetical protein
MKVSLHSGRSPRLSKKSRGVIDSKKIFDELVVKNNKVGVERSPRARLTLKPSIPGGGDTIVSCRFSQG